MASNTNFLKIFAIFFSIIICINTTTILLDKINPLIMNKPSFDQTGYTINIGFTLASNSLGLMYQQYIAVGFPKSFAGNDLFLDTMSMNSQNIYTPRFNCAVADAYGTSYLFTPVPSKTGSKFTQDSNVFYCRFDDLTNVIYPGNSYTLTITLTYIKILSTQYVRSLSLFTCSSNGPDKIIIDNLPVIGSLALYNNWTATNTLTPPLLDITSVTPTITTGVISKTTTTTTTIYPYNVFDLAVNCKVNGYISMDSYFVIKYPIDTVVGPISITSTALSTTDINQIALAGTLGLAPFEANSMVITGISENLVINRQFQLYLKGWSSLDTNIGIAKNFEIWVYYKNTYSVLSYQYSSVFFITAFTLNIPFINHPESVDMYAGAAWPLQINFSPNADMLSGGYVMIYNYSYDYSSKFTFSAATCDFSMNGNYVEQNFGVRPVCSPIQNDVIYPASSGGTNYNGSGIIFKLNKMLASVVYTVVVWGVADICGNIFPPADNYPSTNLAFKASVYKNFDITRSGYDKVTYAANIKLTTDTTANISNKCWGVEDQINYVGSLASTPLDTIMYNEYNNFNLLQTTTGVTGSYEFNPFTATPTPIYLNSYTYSATSYLMLKADFSLTGAMKSKFAFPLDNISAIFAGKVVVYISKGWFDNSPLATVNPKTCSLSWMHSVNSAALPTIHQLGYPPGTYTSANNNVISTDASTPSIDTSNLKLPLDIPTTMITIPSVLMAGGNFDATINNSLACPTPPCPASFNLFTNCLVLTAKPPVIKSMYSYIDIIYTYQVTVSAVTSPSRIARFVKLYPEMNVFNTPATTNYITSMYTFHYTTTASYTNESICVLQLNGPLLTKYVTDNSSQGFLMMFLFNLSLLDIDYTQNSTTYPALTSGFTVTAFGLNNSAALTQSNRTQKYFVNPPAATQAYQAFLSFSTYYFLYLSSVIMINPASTISAASDIYIPVICPFANTSGVNINSSIPAVTTIMGNYSTTNANVFAAPISFYGVGASIATSLMHIQPIILKTGAPVTNYTFLRFDLYSTSGNFLYVYNGTANNLGGTTTNCSAFTFLVSLKIPTYSNTLNINVNGNSITPYLYFSPNSFSIMGKVFFQIIIGVSSTGALSVPSSATNSPIYFTGLVRPTVDQFYNSTLNSFITTDLVGFFCNSSTADLAMMTNYVIDIVNVNTVSNFILDFNPDNAIWNMISFSSDKPIESYYQNDIGSSISMVFTTPSPISTGAFITITNSGNFNPNTICGIMNILYSSVCTLSAGGYTVFNCPVNYTSNKFTICCYNVLLTDQIVISGLQATFPINPAIINLSQYMTSAIYSAQSSILTLNTGNAGLSPISSITPYFQNIAFSYTNQEKGIGKISFDISLGRELPRDAKIYLNGNFSGMLIPNADLRCIITVGYLSYDFSDLMHGDMFLDSCNVSNISQLTNSIVILTKRDIIMCGLTLNNILRVSIYPVINYNFYNDLTLYFSVNISSRITGDDLALNNTPYSMPAVTYGVGLFSPLPIVNGIWGSLCSVQNIYPRVVEEVAYYDFEFDLYSNRAALQNMLPNEFSIFFPFIYYGGDLSRYQCIFLTNKFIKVNCSNEMEGVLTIKFSSQLTITNTNPIIRVVGILNPGIDKAIVLPCTVNYIDGSGNRSNLITGSGNLVGGITNPVAVNMGNLRIVNSNSNSILSNPIPRSLGQITLKITFDTANGSLIPAAIPFVHIIITFPNEYQFSYFNQLQITATIDEWLSNDSNVAIYSSSLVLTSVTVYANTVAIVLTDVSRAFLANFQYWIINLSNVPAPFDNISTASIKVCLTNKDFSYVYKTFTNLNTIATTPLPTPLNQYLTYYRGLSYNYDNSRFVIDIYPMGASPGSGLRNTITITPGLFSTYYFYVIPNSVIPSGTTVMTLYDINFKMGNASYNVITTLGQTFFTIGASCATTPGIYYITFTSSDKINFVKTQPIQVKVGIIIPATIYVSNDSFLPPSSTSILSYSLSQLNFDKLSISWIGNSTNDSSATISSVDIQPQSSGSAATFTISNPNQINAQVFLSTNPNSCFSLATNSISITPGAKPYPDLTQINNSVFRSSFYFYDGNSSPGIGLNTIRFEYLSVITPGYLYCAITCYNSNFVSDFTIKNTLSGGAFFNSYISSLQPKITFDFTNLMRGQRYKVRCILTTTQFNLNLRQSISVQFDDNINLQGAQTVTPSSINTITQNSTQCLRFIFSQQPGSVVKSAILNSCQLAFNSQVGCIICMDQNGVSLAGLSTRNYLTCDTPTSNKYYQTINTTTPFGGANSLGANIFYTVCIVQDKFCSSDSSTLFTTLNSWRQLLGTSTNFAGNLNLPIPPLVGTSLLNDNLTPLVDNIVVETYTITNFNGSFMFRLHNGYNSAMFCYWLISASSITNYTFSNLQNCSDITRCGTIKINTISVNLNANPNNLRIFLTGSYSLWIACYNDIPNPTIQSNVVNISNFNASPGLGNSVMSSGQFIDFKYFSGLLILLVIFIIN